jgi:hypothetical protein
MLFALCIKYIDKEFRCHGFDDPIRPESFYAKFPLSFCRRRAIFFVLIIKRSGQHVASGISQNAVDAGTSSNLLLKVLHIFFIFAYHFVLLFMEMFGWFNLNAHKCKYKFQLPLPKVIAASNGKVTIHSIRNRTFLSRRVRYLVFHSEISFHYCPVKSKNLCQWNDW